MEEADAAGATAQEAAEAEEELGGEEGAAANEQKIEYDEEGKPIAKSENELTNELYQNNIVNYLVVPKDAELPAGLEKDCVIITKPVKNSYIASEEALDMITGLDQKESIAITDTDQYEEPPFKEIVRSKTDLAILPDQALPEKVTKKSSDEEKELSKEKAQTLKKLQTRYSSLSVPLIIDRGGDEATTYGQAEWIKIYGVIFGEEKAAADYYDKYLKENKEEKIEHEQ